MLVCRLCEGRDGVRRGAWGMGHVECGMGWLYEVVAWGDCMATMRWLYQVVAWGDCMAIMGCYYVVCMNVCMFTKTSTCPRTNTIGLQQKSAKKSCVT